MDLENRQVSIWGDSILKGVVLDETDGRYHVLRNSCVDQFAELTGTEISNHASFGMTTGKALERIKRAFTKAIPDKNDIVVLEYGGNDCDFHWAEVAADPERKHSPKTPIDQFGTLFQSIIDLCKSAQVMPVLMTLPPLDPGKYFAWLSRGLNAENLRAWLGDINRIYRWQEAYNDIVAQVANVNGLPLINIRKDFLVSEKYTSLICADGIHPNESGHASILRSVLTYVRGL